MSSLRTNPCFQALMEVCDEYDIQFRVEHGGKHPRLIFEVDGREHRFSFPGSPSDHRSAANSASQFRAVIDRLTKPQTEAGASLATEPAPVLSRNLEGNETMSGSTEGEVESKSVLDIGLHMIGEEPRALDTDLGERLGMARPDKIRQTIESNRAELEQFGPLASVRTLVPIGSGAHREVEVTYLNEEQALLVAALSRAPRAKEVRAMLIHVFVAWRRGQLGTIDPEMVRRIDGIARMLSHKVTEIERAVPVLAAGIEEAQTASTLAMEVAGKLEARLGDGPIAPTFDFGSTVTADQMIEAAGVAKADRQRGTTQMVTNRMQEFCAARGVAGRRTPADLNPARPWRFPRDLAMEWLFGASLGAELIRNQIATQARKKHRENPQKALRLVPQS